MERKTFKTKWNKVDEVCPNCNQITKVNRGLTKQNLKKMFQKPTPQDWVIFIMLVLAMLGALSFQSEIQYYREILENPQELCYSYNENILQSYLDDIDPYNIDNTILIEDEEIK